MIGESWPVGGNWQATKLRRKWDFFFPRTYFQQEWTNPAVFFKHTHTRTSDELVYACNEVTVARVRLKKTSVTFPLWYN